MLRMKQVLLFSAIALTGIGLSIAFFVFLYNSETGKISQRQERIDADINSARSAFNDVVDQIETSLTNALRSATISATSVSGLFAVFPNTTFPQFTSFVYGSNIITSYVRAYYYIPRVPASQAKAFQQRFRNATGINGFTIRSSDTSDYYPITYMEPLSETSLGANYQSVGNSRVVALNKSRDTAAPAASWRNSFSAGNATEYGFVIFLPIYDTVIGNGSGATVDQRRTYFRGVTGSSFRIAPLIQQALGSRTNVRVYIFDGSPLTPDTSLLYTNTNATGNTSIDNLTLSSSHVLVSVPVVDRTWQLVVDTAEFTSPFHPYRRTPAPPLVLAGVLLATAATLIYLVDALRRQERIQLLTEEQAADVQAADELADQIAEMKLDHVKLLDDASPLQQKLYRIVTNLRRYRPYLPDILFASDHESGEETGTAAGGRSDKRHQSVELQSTGSLHSSNGTGGGVYRVQERSADGSRSSTSKTRVDRMAQRLNGGMANRQVSLLLVRVHGLHGLADQDGGAADTVVADALAACAHAIRTHQGSLTQCGLGAFLATWNAASTVANHQVRACRCALDLESALQPALARHHPRLALGIAIDTGLVLAGNVCTASVSAFHLLGGRVQQLDAVARLAPLTGASVLLTTAAYRSVQSLFVLRPVEIVDLAPLQERADGGGDAAVAAPAKPEVVYELPSQPVQMPGHDEWMYNLSRVERSVELERAFAHLLSGQPAEAAPLLRQFALNQPHAAGRVAHLIEFCAVPKQEARYRRVARPTW